MKLRRIWIPPVLLLLVVGLVGCGQGLPPIVDKPVPKVDEPASVAKKPEAVVKEPKPVIEQPDPVVDESKAGSTVPDNGQEAAIAEIKKLGGQDHH